MKESNSVLQTAENNKAKCPRINTEQIETNDEEAKSFYAALHATGMLCNLRNREFAK